MTKGMKKLKETTRDRHLQWINYYSNNNFGIWIECTKCKKWRKNYRYDESHEVEENWCCSMNILDNGTKGNCDDPEENTEEEYLEYSPGSIVWAKLDGYPWWPAMVDEDPDIEEYYWVDKNGSLDYNVTFLDEHVTRSWVSSKNICPFLNPPRNRHLLRRPRAKYSSALMKAEEKAQTAVKMAFKDRLQKFSFVHLYKGKWPLAKDDEPEDDPRDMTDILLDEVNDLDSLLSFDSDMSDNLTLPEKKKDRHEESQTILSGVVNTGKSKTNMDVSDSDFTDSNMSCAGKNKHSINSSALAMKDLKGKHDLKLMGNKHSKNISKSKKIHQPFEKRMKSLKKDKKLKVSETEIESLTNEIKNNTDTNQKGNKLNNLKDDSNCKNIVISNQKQAEQKNQKCIEITKQVFDKNLNIKDKNSECKNLPQNNLKCVEIAEQELEKNSVCKTLTENNSLVLSEISHCENTNNINSSIEWVVNEYKVTENMAINKKVEIVGGCQPVVAKENKKPDVCKFSKKVSDKNNQKKVISFLHNKNVLNGDVTMNKKKKKPEESLNNNANKKFKPSFSCSKLPLKTTKKQIQCSLENVKQSEENSVGGISTISAAISKCPDTMINSSKSKNDTFNGKAGSLPNDNKLNAIDENFKSQKIDTELSVNHDGPLSNHCTTSPKLSYSNTDFSEGETTISNGLTPKKTSNNLPNPEVQDKAFLKESETVIHSPVKDKTLKIHKKKKPVLSLNNKIMKPEAKTNDSIDTDSKCTTNHESFNLIKMCENFTESKIVAVADDSSAHSSDVNSPSKIKNPDDGFFDISLSDEELEI